MQTARIVQAVALMLIVALAASCAASKEYTSKLFAPRTPVVKDSTVTALRFLELDRVKPDQDNWVSTDIIMGRDTGSRTTALDKLATVFPAKPVTQPAADTAALKEEKGILAGSAKKPAAEEEPIVKSTVQGAVRTKTTREK